jgi:hypothetical protein
MCCSDRKDAGGFVENGREPSTVLPAPVETMIPLEDWFSALSPKAIRYRVEMCDRRR